MFLESLKFPEKINNRTMMPVLGVEFYHAFWNTIGKNLLVDMITVNCQLTQKHVS